MKPVSLKQQVAVMFLILISFMANSQVSNFIYAINDSSSSGNSHFCKIDLTNGTLTNIAVVNLPSSLGAVASCIDNNTKTYYYSNGTTLTGLNAITGNITSNVSFLMPSGGEFWYPAFNPCDSNIYGIINNAPSSVSLARVNPGSGVITIISALDPSMLFPVGGVSIVDPATNVYSFRSQFFSQAGGLVGLNCSSGQVEYNTPILNVPNETFGHMALKASTHEIFGTSAQTSILGGVKYLSTLNPNTGVVTHVSDYPWTTGITKPIYGGDCINQLDGTYYYAGHPNLLIGVNTVTGDTLLHYTVNARNLQCVQHFSQGSCLSSDIGEEEDNTTMNIYPNPASAQLFIQTSGTAIEQVNIYNTTGSLVMSAASIINNHLSIVNLANGVYIAEIKTKEGSVRKRWVKM